MVSVLAQRAAFLDSARDPEPVEGQKALARAHGTSRRASGWVPGEKVARREINQLVLPKRGGKFTLTCAGVTSWQRGVIIVLVIRCAAVAAARCI
jgi:hypothetical protein